MTGTASVPTLAEEYELPERTVATRAKHEAWLAERRAFRDAVKAAVKDGVAKEAMGAAVEMTRLAMKTMRSLEDLIGNYSSTITPRTITGALRDLQEILYLKDPRDVEEQNARIAKLKREAAEETAAREITVTIEGAGDGWAT